MCIDVDIYTHANIYVYVYKCMHTNICIHLYVLKYMNLFKIYEFMCISIFTYNAYLSIVISFCIYVCVYTYKCMYMNICKCTYVYVCIAYRIHLYIGTHTFKYCIYIYSK